VRKLSDLHVKANDLVEKWIQGYRRGSLRFFILHLFLYEEHNREGISKEGEETFHGYNIAKSIHKITEGKWHPTTASIYPILKQFEEEGVIEEIEYVKATEGTRFTKKFKLTPFGKTIAEKVGQARENFSKAFKAERKRVPHIPLMKLRLQLSDKEIIELLEETDLNTLESERDHLKEVVTSFQETLKKLENEISKRKNLE
jgi:DNA-binding PadR family transcriptional regulator